MIDFIKGGGSRDHRGEICFVNDFDMAPVKRFYVIKNADTEVIRGWRAHKIEQRWFYVLAGAFELAVVQVDDWRNPSKDLAVERYTLRAEDQQVIHVPPGYGTALRAMEAESELLVFADYGIDHASQDDYTWPADYFVK